VAYYGKHGDAQKAAAAGFRIAGVVSADYTDVNVPTPWFATVGFITEVTTFDDGASRVRCFPYGGLQTPGLGATFYRGTGPVRGGLYGEGSASAVIYGGAVYWRIGRMEDEGRSTQHGSALSTPGLSGFLYYVVHEPSSSELTGAQPYTTYP